MKTRSFMKYLAVFVILLLVAGLTIAAADARTKVKKTVEAGDKVDVGVGACGVFMSAAPYDGELVVDHTTRGVKRLNFVKDPCTLDYENYTKAPTAILYYITLNRVQHQLWQDNRLAFYTESGQCAAAWVPGGEFGRLSCWSTDIGMFGIVKLPSVSSAKETDDEKAPAGTKVEVGQTYSKAKGNCGVSFTAMPEDGYVQLKKIDKHTSVINFVKDACEVKLENLAGKSVESSHASVLVFFNLDSAHTEMWRDGELAFYVDGAPCAAVFTGSRLACWTNRIGKFGIVDIAEKVADEDEDEKTKDKVPAGKQVKLGQRLDIAEGACGAYFASVPSAGYVDMGRSDRHSKDLKFVKDVCKLSYEDMAENQIKSYDGLLLTYININQSQLDEFNEGNLAFYVKQGNNWTQCDAMHFQNGSTDRLCCMTSTVGEYGLVDITEKESSSD